MPGMFGGMGSPLAASGNPASQPGENQLTEKGEKEERLRDALKVSSFSETWCET